MLGLGRSSRRQHDGRRRLSGQARRELRLDPVRWQRPGRGTLIRLATVTVLLGTAALAVWSRPTGCAPPEAQPAPVSQPSPGSQPPPGSSSADCPGSGDRPDTRDLARSTGPAGRTDSGSGTNAGPIDDAPPNRPPDAQNRPAIPPGTLGVPVRLAEVAALTLVSPGDQVELLTVQPSGGAATRIAENALVLGVTNADDPTTNGLLLALTPTEARTTLTTPQDAHFAILLRPQTVGARS